MAQVEIYEDANQEFRWRLVEGNGRIVASSGEGFITFGGCRRALANVVGEFRGEIDVIVRDAMIKRRSVNNTEPEHSRTKIDSYPVTHAET